MKSSVLVVFAVVLLSSGCSTGQQGAVPEEGATYTYSVKSEDVDGAYSLTLVDRQEDVQEYVVSSEIRGGPMNGSFALNSSSLDYVEKDRMVDRVIFNYLGAYARPFPFVFWDLRPKEAETVVGDGNVQKQDYSLKYEGSIDSYRGFKAVNVSLSHSKGDQVVYYVVSTERPYLLLSASTDSGYEVRLESVEN